jgi:transposase-like protein
VLDGAYFMNLLGDEVVAKSFMASIAQPGGQELKRRSLVVRIFPNEASCLRLIRALAAEQHEEWLDGARYLDMQPLADLHNTQLQLAA